MTFFAFLYDMIMWTALFLWYKGIISYYIIISFVVIFSLIWVMITWILYVFRELAKGDPNLKKLINDKFSDVESRKNLNSIYSVLVKESNVLITTVLQSLNLFTCTFLAIQQKYVLLSCWIFVEVLKWTSIDYRKEIRTLCKQNIDVFS